MLLEMVGAVTDDIAMEVWLPNDLEHLAAPLCHELIRRGVPVRHLSLPIMRRANRNTLGFVALLRRSVSLLRELKAAKPQGVYCTTSPTFLGAPIARLAGVPSVIGHSQEIWSRADRYVLSGPARACHSMVAISRAVAQSLPAGLQRRTTIIPNGTPEPLDVTSLADRAGELQFLVASRWNGWKGHRTLIEAWDLAGAPGRLVVLGAEPPSGDSVDVRALVATLGRPESVSIIGEVPDTSKYLEQADVVILPSDRPEPFGLVAIEAFARGRPVIGSAGGGLLDIVTPGTDGWLFPPGHSSALASVLSTITREEVAAAGARARQTYLSRFTEDRFVDDWRKTVVGPWLEMRT
jgi:glycosyltransferase involved in cell wall biosynthesis